MYKWWEKTWHQKGIKNTYNCKTKCKNWRERQQEWACVHRHNTRFVKVLYLKSIYILVKTKNIVYNTLIVWNTWRWVGLGHKSYIVCYITKFRANDEPIFIRYLWGMHTKLILLNIHPRILIFGPYIIFTKNNWPTFYIYLSYMSWDYLHLVDPSLFDSSYEFYVGQI